MRMKGPGSILVADDEPLIAHDIARIARSGGYEVAAVITDPARFAAAVARERPRLALVDIRFGLQDGIDLIGGLPPELRPRVLYVSAHTDEVTVRRAALTACIGFVAKPFSEEQLLAAMRVAFESSFESSPVEARPTEQDTRKVHDALSKIAVLLAEAGLTPRPNEPHDIAIPATLDLSPREREVVAALLRHGRVARVATALHISPHTVRNHVKAIYQKLGVHSVAELFDHVHQARRATKS